MVLLSKLIGPPGGRRPAESRATAVVRADIVNILWTTLGGVWYFTGILPVFYIRERSSLNLKSY